MRHFLTENLKSWFMLLVSLCVAVAGAQLDWVQAAENEQLAGVTQLSKKDASGQIHIVEVDADSIASLRQWPWPRDHHARLIEELDKAGARSVVFDIDFSSHSSPAEDQAFADAIAAADLSVALPTFAQAASENSDRRLDALPIAILRENASLASASVLPDADARVRRMVYGTVTEGTPRPSMSAYLAGSAGEVDSSFAIDFSIDPQSIPRHSFIAVENGEFDKAAIAGKDVLVGATAIELGDRYGVPSYGVIPGVTIQALAAETLLAGGLNEQGWMPLVLLSLVLALAITFAWTYAQVALRTVAALVTVLAVEIIAYHYAMTVLAVVPAAILIVSTATAQTLRIARSQLRDRALLDSETGLPNALAFAARTHDPEDFVIAAYIKEFDSIQAVLGKEQTGKFIERLIDRMSATLAIQEPFRADTRMLAWVYSGDYQVLVDAFEEISEELKKPLKIGAARIDAGVAFGIAHGGELAAATRAASFAAQEGKLWHAHEDAETAIIEQRVTLMGELDEAIGAGQLKVVYQPKLRLETDRIESVEALVRWEHPERGYMRPDLFIPLAEETNRIEPLTLFVLKQTIRDLSEWCKQGAVASAAVNISAKLITSEHFINAAEQILTETQVPRDRLIFEVTESATMRDPDLAAANLNRFRKLGVLVSMDDYGTGQSTLSYLQKLPLTELKIDRAFVQNAHRDRSDALLVRSTIQLAHSLGLRVVCEGVEEEACLEFLREAGCDYAQGYLISKPVAPAEIVSQLARADRQVEAG